MIFGNNDILPSLFMILDNSFSNLVQMMNPNKILNNFLKVSTALMKADSSTVVFWEENLGYFNLTYNLPDDIEIKGKIINSDKQGLDGRVYRENDEMLTKILSDKESDSIQYITPKITYLTNFSKNFDAYSSLKEIGYSYAIGIPVIIEGKIEGTVSYYFNERDDKLNNDEQEFMQHLSKRFSLLVMNLTYHNELHEKTNKLEELNGFMNVLFDSTTDIIIHTDTLGRIKYFNRSCETLLKYDDEILNTKIKISSDNEDDTEFYKELQKIQKGKQYSGNFSLLTNETTPNQRRISTTIVPVKNKDNKITSVLISGKDITDQLELQNLVDSYDRKIEDQDKTILHSQQDFEALKIKQAETKKIASVAEISNKLGHKINNPLMGLLNHQTIIKDGLLSMKNDREEIKKESLGVYNERIEEMVESIDEITKEIYKIHGIIKDLREFTDITLDDTHIRENNIIDVLKKVIQELKPLAEENNIVIKSEISKTLGSKFIVLSTFQGLKIIIKSIIENAIYAIIYDDEKKRDPNKKEIIQITAKKIKLKGKEHIKLAVTDNGCGILPSQIKSLFVPFFSQWKQPQESIKIHTGINLATTKKLLDLMNPPGKIIVESEPGANTTFIIEIPKNILEF